MLSAQRLISSSKPERVLPGHLFPLNNNRGLLDLEDVYAATVFADSSADGTNKEVSPCSDSAQTTEGAAGQQIIGFGLFHKCTPNQFYCSLLSVSKHIEPLFVNVERVAELKKSETENEENVNKGTGRHILLRLTDVHQALPDLSSLPQYFSAFAEPIGRPLLQCIFDEFVRIHVGIHEMETRRNFTVDLYDADSGIDEHPDTQWRDFAGFVVADRFRYCEIELDSVAFLSSFDDNSLSVNAPVVLHSLSPSNRALFHDYDQSVSVMGRKEYLDFLLNLAGMEGVIAIDEQKKQLIGYILAYGERVLQCYADEEKVAGALFCAVCRALRSPASLSLFLRLSNDEFPLLSARLFGAASRVRRVRRFHSRSVPAAVKWAKVLAPAIGLHLF
ncbi:hypothetical protein niasHT_039823 [Heterodera trifolii]|uniref:DUF7596 domain-containing protein n=1 Tax=Heterodera trifolii TaxID=157864 RepID=A0ABD2IQ53_9BILA